MLNPLEEEKLELYHTDFVEKKKLKRHPVVIILIILFGTSSMAEEFQERVKQPVDRAISIRQQTQVKEDKWAEERSRMQAEYEKLQLENQALETRRTALDKEVDSWRERVDALEKQLVAIEQISSRLMPFLRKTVEEISVLIQDGLPFLLPERRARIDILEKVLDDRDVSLGEKFRKTMETLFSEAEYGNTIEVYQEKIELENRSLLANVFRVGRLALLCQSLDRQTTGVWDPVNNSWQSLPAEYQRDVHMAIEMGKKRRSVDLLDLPLGKVVVK